MCREPGEPAANRRRAASDDPLAQAGGVAGCAGDDDGVGRGRARKLRASSHGVDEAIEIAVEADQIKQIAMFAGRRIGPFAGRTRSVIGSLQSHIEAAARRVHDVADQPVTARTASIGEVVTAHGLGIAREAAREIGGSLIIGSSRDHAAARVLARSSGWRSRSAARIAGPRSAAIGTNSRKRQAMISEVRPEGLQLRHSTIGIAGEFDAMHAHHQRAADLLSPARSSTAPRSSTAFQASSWERPGALSTPKA